MGNEFFFHHHHRAQRGDLEPIILNLLCEKPMHGYEIIRTLEERSHGFWRPSPGSVYPILQFLEESDLVTSHDEHGKKVYAITDAGRDKCENAPENTREHAFHHHMKAGLRFRDMRGEIRDLVRDLKQVGMRGSDDQVNEVKQMIKDFHARLKTLVEDIENEQTN